MKTPRSNSNALDSDTLAHRRGKYNSIIKLLETAYGYPAWRPHLPPVDELVSTILSQSTSDTNRDTAFYALKNRYPSWQAVRDAPLDAIIDTIRPAGLANQKAPRIQAALHYISDGQGQPSLDHLAEMDTQAAKDWLTHIHGIGPKTAAIILLFAFNKPAFPVDTHVHRVTRRLGLIGPKTSAERAHRELEAIIPPEDYYPAHLNIIRHGREVCQARRPNCEACPLTAYCDYYLNQQVLD
ncbi:MAG: endonuclease III [Anaerolineae bacterium]|jgi:endonuclease-3|nr:endonuclease III [Anaerolineae bacterium]